MADPRSGIDDEGVWTPAFSGQRSPTVSGQPGPALRHGAYSSLAIGERAEELAEEVRSVCPLYSAADEPAIKMLGVALARVEKAVYAIDRVDEILGDDKRLAAYMTEDGDRLDRLRRDARAWMGVATKLMSELGLTASSRARLGLDVALAQRAADDALDRLTAEGRRIREARVSS